MLFIFDRNYELLKIIEEYEDFKRTEKVNSSDLLSFSTEEVEYIERYNKVGLFNSNDEFQLFLIDDVTSEYTEGKTKVSVDCISDICVLRNHIIEDKRIVEGSIDIALEKALEGTEYKVGNVEQFELRNINFYYISSLQALNDILNTYKCEFSVRIEIDPEAGIIKNKYIDLKHRLGEDTGLRFTYDINLNHIEKSNLTEGHFNVLYGRGKALETDNGGYSRKLDFSSINDGKKYVEDANSIAKYGRLEGIYENSNIDTPETLLKSTLEKLQETKEPKYSYVISIDDLSATKGFEHYKVVKGDTIAIIDEESDLVIEARIIEVVKTNDNSLLTLGNFIEGLSSSIDDSEMGDLKDKVDIIENNPLDESKYPNTLPAVPKLSAEGLFSTVSLEWTFENKLYYTYEIFASKIKDFAPDSTNRIYEGKASAFLHEVKPSETWYYRARAKNTHDKATGYSAQVEASTLKISDAAEWFEEAAIGHAIIGSLDADKITAGTVKGNRIDAKNLSVTDGNGKKTLEVDSFGRVRLDVTDLKINAKDITESINELETFKTEAEQKITPNAITSTVRNSQEYKDDLGSKTTIDQVKSEVKQEADKINQSINSLDGKYNTVTQEIKDGVNQFKVEVGDSGGGNFLVGGGKRVYKKHNYVTTEFSEFLTLDKAMDFNSYKGDYITLGMDVKGWNSSIASNFYVGFELKLTYDDNTTDYFSIAINKSNVSNVDGSTFKRFKISKRVQNKNITTTSAYITIRGFVGEYIIKEFSIVGGQGSGMFVLNNGEAYGSNMSLTGESFEVRFSNGTKMLVNKDNPLTLVDGSTNRQYHALSESGTIVLGGYNGTFPVEAWIQLPNLFKGKQFKVSTSMGETRGGHQDAEWVQKVRQEVIEYDYANGRFKLWGSWWSRTTANDIYQKELSITWMAIA